MSHYPAPPIDKMKAQVLDVLIEKYPSHEPTFLNNIVNKGFDTYEHKDELKKISMIGWSMLYKTDLVKAVDALVRGGMVCPR